jgi:single-stranded DNA-binding protein
MNSCFFIGKIVGGDPALEQENGSTVVRFHVSIEEFRKDQKTGTKKKMYTTLNFEAWDTGAEAICNNCQDGTIIAIESSARYDEETEETYFRVKNFRAFR